VDQRLRVGGVVPVGSIISDASSGAGFIAATIAVCGFLGQVWPALTRQDDKAVRAATVVGGLVGLFVAVGIIFVGRGMW
jgi:hypothetical protein